MGVYDNCIFLLKKQKIVGYVLILFLVVLYIIMSYKSARAPPYRIVSQISEINPFFLLPFVGIIAFLYGLWSKDKLLSFFIGFLPPVSGSLSFIMFTHRVSIVALQSLIFMQNLPLAFSYGLMGYGGALQKERGWDWILIVSGGVLLWLSLILI